MSNRHLITEFILLIADGWNGRVPEVLNAVRSAGGELTSFDVGNGIVEGSIHSMDLPRLERLACVRRLVEGASYVTYRFPGEDDHGFGCGHPGATHPGARAHPPEPHRFADISSPTLRPSACRPKPRTPLRPPARPPAFPGYDSPDLNPGHLDFSQRLLWTAEDRAQSESGTIAGTARRVFRTAVPDLFPAAIPLGVRLAYGVVAVLGVAIATHTAMDVENAGCLSIVQLLSGSLLAVLATLAACGLCRFRVIRHVCTGMGLWLAASSCLLQRSFSGLDMALGLAAFLLAGCAADGLSDT